MRSRARMAASLLCLLALLAACASTTVGRAVQVAEAQKLLVERAAVELIVLHRQGKITDETLAKVRAAYERWAPLQAALSEAMAQWRLVASTENNDRVEAALRAVAAVTDEYLKLAGQHVDLERLSGRAP